MRNYNSDDAKLGRARRRVGDRRIAPLFEQQVRGAIAVQRADVDVGVAGLHSSGAAAERQIRVDERADVLVARIALAPQRVQLAQDRARHLERAPDPVDSARRRCFTWISQRRVARRIVTTASNSSG